VPQKKCAIAGAECARKEEVRRPVSERESNRLRDTIDITRGLSTNIEIMRKKEEDIEAKPKSKDNELQRRKTQQSVNTRVFRAMAGAGVGALGGAISFIPAISQLTLPSMPTLAAVGATAGGLVGTIIGGMCTGPKREVSNSNSDNMERADCGLPAKQ
jgi:hypothetical protein